MIDDPGLLYTHLLLMGDRTAEDTGGTSSPLTTGFDSLWGAGKLRMRMWDEDGMDTPGEFRTGRTCVRDGEAVYPFSELDSFAETDYVKAVAWWYDPTHDDAGNGYSDYDRVSLEIELYDASLDQWDSLGISAELDNRQRIKRTPHPWKDGIRLKLSPLFAIEQDNGGCGANAVRVYWAVLWEANDRDDDVNLNNWVRPEP